MTSATTTPGGLALRCLTGETCRPGQIRGPRHEWLNARDLLMRPIPRLRFRLNVNPLVPGGVDRSVIQGVLKVKDRENRSLSCTLGQRWWHVTQVGKEKGVTNQGYLVLK